MTKVRPPLTIENALFRILGSIGVERAAELLGLSTHHVYALSDPDKRERLAWDDAVLLDLEFMTRGGEGAPIYETYGLLLGAAAAERFTDASALARHAATISRETGEATAAIIEAAQPGSTVADKRAAAREAEQAVTAIVQALPLLTRDVVSSPGPQPTQDDVAGGNARGPPA